MLRMVLGAGVRCEYSPMRGVVASTALRAGPLTGLLARPTSVAVRNAGLAQMQMQGLNTSATACLPARQRWKSPSENKKKQWRSRNRVSLKKLQPSPLPDISKSLEEELEQKLTDFNNSIQNEGTKSEPLALQLNARERAWVHLRCDQLGLKSKSEGKGQIRTIVVREKPEIVYNIPQKQNNFTVKAPSNAAILSAEQPPEFKPELIQRNLLQTLNIEEAYHRNKEQPIPFFTPGSIVRVHYQEARSRNTMRRVVGIVTSKVNRGLGSNFTIRNVLEGLPFEMSFDIYHPLVYEIEVLELQRRKRAKLNYLRDRPNKESTFSANYQPRGGR